MIALDERVRDRMPRALPVRASLFALALWAAHALAHDPRPSARDGTPETKADNVGT